MTLTSFQTGRGLQSGTLQANATTPGFYTGTYQVQPGDDIVAAQVTLHFEDWAGNTVSFTTDRFFSIDTRPPALGEVTLLKNGQPLGEGQVFKAGDRLGIRLVAEPGLRVQARLGSLIQGLALERTGQEGEDVVYAAVVDIRPGMDVQGAKVTVEAEDAAGHRASVQSTQAVTIDSLPPAVQFRLNPKEPDGMDGWYRTRPTVTFRVEAGATLVVKSGSQTVNLPDPRNEGNESVYEWSVPDGEWIGLTVQARDAAGNETPPFPLPAIRVDTVRPDPPTLATSTLSPTATPAIDLEGRVAGPDVTRVALYAGGEFWGYASVNPETRTFRFTGVRLVEDLVNRGVNTFTAVAIDRAGNQSEASQPVRVVRDTTPPSFQFEVTPDPDGTSGTVTVTVSEPLANLPDLVGWSGVAPLTLTPTGGNPTASQPVFTYRYMGASGDVLRFRITGQDGAGNQGTGRYVNVRLNPVTGGTVATDDGAVVAEFSSGDLQGQNGQPVQVTITSYVAENLRVVVPRGTRILGSAYSFQAALAPKASVDVTFKVRMSGTVPDQIGIYHFPLTGGLPELVMGTVVDRRDLGNGNWEVTIRATLPHFSVWAPFVDNEPPAFVGAITVNGVDAALAPAVKTPQIRVAGSVDGSARWVRARLGSQVVAVQDLGDLTSGNKSFTLTVPLGSGDGPRTVTVEAVDPFGNVASRTVAVTLDTTPPAVAGLTVNGAAYTGKVFTTSATAAVAGSSPGGLMTVRQGNQVLVEDVAGSFNVTVSLPANQDETLTITARDAALDENGEPTGNVSQPVSVFLRRDTAPPEIELSGLASGDTLTSADSLTIGYVVRQLGGAVPEDVASVTISLGSVVVTRTEAEATGIPVPLPTADDTYTLTVTAVDRAGNATTMTRTVVKDSNVPRVAISAPEVTREGNVQVTVASVPGGQVQIQVNGQARAPAVIPDSGTYTFTLEMPSDGTYLVEVAVTGPTGLTGTGSVLVRRDSTPPQLKVEPVPTITTTATVTITGQAEAGALITATGPAGTVTTTANANGNFTLAVTLHPGANTIAITAADSLGNITQPMIVQITYNPPAGGGAPPGGGGAVGGGLVPPTLSLAPTSAITREATATLRGTATPGASLTVRRGEAIVANLTVPASGSFTVTVDLAEGVNTFTLLVSSAGGSASATVTITRDTRAPTLTAWAEAELTRAATAVVRVTAEQGARILVNGQEVATAGAGGTAVLTLTLAEGENQFRITAVDAAGNESAPVNLTIVRDSRAPALAVQAPQQPVSAATAELTVITEPGVAVRVGAREVGKAGADGRLTVTVPLALGQNVLTVVARDAAGNEASATVTLYRRTPQTPTVQLAPLPGLTRTPVITVRGTAVPGATVTIQVGGRTATTLSAGADGSFAALVTLGEGTNRIVVTAESDGIPAAATATVRLVGAAIGVPPDMTGHWARDAVADLMAAGIVSGFEDGSFRPDLPVTRAQFAKMVVLALGIDLPSEAQLAFADAVAIPAWARLYVAAATQAGLIAGFEDGTFRADLPITRAQMAVILSRALDLRGLGTGAGGRTFADSDQIPAWAAAAVGRVAAAGLVSGFEDGSFRPADVTTRAQAALVIRRFLEVR